MTATRADAYIAPSGPGTSDTVKSLKNDRKFKHRAVRVDSNGPVFDPLPCLQNGYYQQIVWLGVAGYMIVNHFDRDIVLLDPWPSYHSWWTYDIPKQNPRPLYQADQKTFNRLQDFVNFLRFAHEDDYTISAILLSHMHFDHADDVPIILEMLSRKSDDYKNTTFFKDGHENTISIKLLGKPFATNDLPTVVCDFDTMVYLKTQYFGVPRETLIGPEKGGNFVKEKKPSIGPQNPSKVKPNYTQWRYGYWYGKEQLQFIGTSWLTVSNEVKNRYGAEAPAPDADPTEGEGTAWREIRLNKKTLFYDDCFNDKVYKRLFPDSPIATPGVKADKVRLDRCSFEIQPYIWDHMNASAVFAWNNSSNENQASGYFQRISAFMLSRRLDYNGMNIDYAKKTFFVGSGGEMTSAFTSPAPNLEEKPIKTDVLIQAMMGDEILPSSLSWLADWHLPELMRCCRDYTYKNIEVADYLLWGHYEEFVRWIAEYKKGDQGNEYIERGFKLAYGDNIRALKKIIANNNNIPDGNKKIFTEDKLLALGRMGSNPQARLKDYQKRRNDYYDRKPEEFEKTLPLSIIDLRKMIKDALADGEKK